MNSTFPPRETRCFCHGRSAADIALETASGSAVDLERKPAGRPEAIEQRLAALLGPVPVPVDELARLAETSAREVRAALLALKLAGEIEWHLGDLVSSRPGTWPGADSHED